jgi:carboxyl-terminal processing protease
VILSRRSWFWKILVGSAIALFAALAVVRAAEPPDRPTTEANITRVTATFLGRSQLTHHPLDEQLAGKLIDRYVDALDGSRSLLLRSDVEAWAPMRATLAQATRVAGDTHPAHVIFARYMERLREQVAFDAQLLRGGRFDFGGHDRVSLDREHAERPRDLTAAHEIWREQLRAEYLEEKLSDKPPGDIPAALARRHEQQLKTMSQYGEDQVLEVYLDALAHVYDPHSDYLGKESAESLSISMNLSLFGIGAALESEDGLCTIRELIPGGPAARSGALKPGDHIVAVAQGGGAPVDVVGMPLDRIVELIRGPKDSVVTLTVQPPSGVRSIVRLTRAEVKLEDQQAKARLVDLPRTGAPPLRLGVIDLPSFYTGGDGAGRGGATADVGRLLNKLTSEKAEGIVLDLRHNGGGSLEEAVSLTALFVGGGPVVQTRDANNAITVEADRGATARYTGPLVVLTSRFSASASEIVAGALQDYGRAVVVGDAATFGKGTVQTIAALAPVMDRAGIGHAFDPGALKVTIAKFYRPSGASTELRGVASDLIIPSPSGALPVGESKLTDPLPWDTVPPARYESRGEVAPYLTALRDASSRRLVADPTFDDLRQEVARLATRINDNSVSLNEAERRRDQSKDKALEKAIAADAKVAESRISAYEITVKDAASPGLPARIGSTVRADGGAPVSSAETETKEAKAADARAVDNLVLDESLRVLADYVSLRSKATPKRTGAGGIPTRPGTAAHD